MKNKIILTFDLEFWHECDIIKNYLPESKEVLPDNVLESTLPLLELLESHNIKATFFVAGGVAEKYPELIKKIHSAGHEIASHGYTHRKLENLGKDEFEKEIRLSVDLLSELIGKNPKGFRAPYFSLNNKSGWALEALENNGFIYDSSIFPLKTPLYGDSQAPVDIYKITGKIIELPVAVRTVGPVRIPIAGGFYFRVMPFFIYKNFLKSVVSKRPVVLYFHPHELYGFVPQIKIPFWRKGIKFFGVKESFKKFEKLLKLEDFEFTSAESFLKEFMF